MDKLCVVGLWMLAVGPICFQLSHCATTPPTSENTNFQTDGSNDTIFGHGGTIPIHSEAEASSNVNATSFATASSTGSEAGAVNNVNATSSVNTASTGFKAEASSNINVTDNASTASAGSETETLNNGNVTSSANTASTGSEAEASSSINVTEHANTASAGSETETPPGMTTTPVSSGPVTTGSERETVLGSNTTPVISGSRPTSSETDISPSMNIPLVNSGSGTSGFDTETSSNDGNSTSVITGPGSTGSETEATFDVNATNVNTGSVTSGPEVKTSDVNSTSGNTGQETFNSDTVASIDINTTSVSPGSVTSGPETGTNLKTSSLAANSSQSDTLTDISNTENTGSSIIGSPVNDAVADNNTSGNPTEPLNGSLSNVSSGVNTISGAVEMVNTTSGVTNSDNNGADTIETEGPGNVLSCPRFPSRLVKDTLLVDYEDRCEMEVTVKTVIVRPLTILRMFINKSRVTRKPNVSFKSIDKDESGRSVTCKPLPTKVLDRSVVVEIVKDRCQLVLKVKKATQEAAPSPVQGQTAGKKPSTKSDPPKFKYLPVLEYLDDGLQMDDPRTR